MFNGLPQTIYVGLVALGVLITASKHGEQLEGQHNVYVSVTGAAITLALLGWGGFFS